MKPLNIHVIERTNEYGSWGIGWNDADGMRYHVWLTDDKLGAQSQIGGDEPIIYKNPPAHIPHRGEGDFKTRYLKLSIPKNTVAFNTALTFANDNDLFTKDDERRTAKEAEEKRERHAAYLIKLQKDAGPDLYEALRTILDEATFDYKDDKTRAAIAKASAALSKAQPPTKTEAA